jgi:hypothetical protein
MILMIPEELRKTGFVNPDTDGVANGETIN